MKQISYGNKQFLYENLYRQELAGEIFSGQKIIFYAFLVFIFAYPSPKANYQSH